MILDNMLIQHLEISAYTAYTGYKGNRGEHVFRGLFTPYTPYLPKVINRHTPKILSAANIFCCGTQKRWIHCVHCLQEKAEKATFCKDYVHCIQFIYTMLKVGTSAYTLYLKIFLSFTLKPLRTLLTLGTEGK